MNDRTILDQVRPNVVRRRVVEIVKPAPQEDEEGPPSSVNVARALSSLRGEDLERLERIMREDEEREAAAAAPLEDP